MFNKKATVKDRKQTVTGLVECRLIDISAYFSAGTIPPNWDAEGVTLYTNPQQIDRGLEAIWNGNRTLLSSAQNYQYLGSDRTDVNLTGILIDTQCLDYDATPWLDTLERLTLPGTQSHPPVLAIVWGSRVIQPVVLTKVNIRETAWANGLVSQATVDLSFRYQAGSKYSSNADEARIKSLTEREKAKVKRLAEQQLKTDRGNNKRQPQPQPKQNRVINRPSNQKMAIAVGDDGSITQGDRLLGKYDRSQRLADPVQITV
jgi:hypothetical protein